VQEIARTLAGLLQADDLIEIRVLKAECERTFMLATLDRQLGERWA
jgi:hypothetical protein